MNELVININQEHKQAQAKVKLAVIHAINAGKLLLKAKSGCQHGGWLDWIKTHCHFSERTAQHYMRLAQAYPNTKYVADLSLRQAVGLLQKPRARIFRPKFAQSYISQYEGHCWIVGASGGYPGYFEISHYWTTADSEQAGLFDMEECLPKPIQADYVSHALTAMNYPFMNGYQWAECSLGQVQ